MYLRHIPIRVCVCVSFTTPTPPPPPTPIFYPDQPGSVAELFSMLSFRQLVVHLCTLHWICPQSTFSPIPLSFHLMLTCDQLPHTLHMESGRVPWLLVKYSLPEVSVCVRGAVGEQTEVKQAEPGLPWSDWCLGTTLSVCGGNITAVMSGGGEWPRRLTHRAKMPLGRGHGNSLKMNGSPRVHMHLPEMWFSMWFT